MKNRLSDIFFSYPKTFAFLLGSLMVQALPPFYHTSLLFIALSGLLYLIHNSSSPKKAFISGFSFGFGFFAFGLSWIDNALLISPSETGWLIPIVFLASGAFFGLFIGIPAYFTKRFSSVLFAQYLSFGAWWVIFEWIRSWILTGFPWNMLCSGLNFNLEAMQIAAIIGSYGLSLITYLISAAPCLWLCRPTKRNAVISLTIIVLLSVVLCGFGYYRLKNMDETPSSTVIRLVQPSIPQSIKWSPDLQIEHFQKHLDLTASAPIENIAMTIWGETASPYPLDINEDARNKLIANTFGHYLTAGVIRYENNYYGGWNAYNSALVLNADGIIEDFYDKTHLVPFGEYIPLRQYLPQSIRPIADIISNLKFGSGHKIIKLKDIPPFGIQICYEIIFPHQIINPQDKPDWLINLTNDGWYGISAGPYQHFESARLRAVEEGLTIVRVAGSGISALINPFGKTINHLDLGEIGILDISLPQTPQIKTLYNTFGNWTALLLCLLCLIAAKIINEKYYFL